jgi:protein-S-isoprenylcysteine O-methyltransferase Ste14
MLNSLFKIIYLAEFIVASVIRKIYTVKYRNFGISLSKRTKGDILFLVFDGIGMTLPLVYLFSSLLDGANYSLPQWIGWLGALLFAFSIWLLWRSHADLGRYWTPTLGIREKHELVTHGVFKYIRHPMYSAHLLWALAQALMLHNWIAGFSFLVTIIPHYLVRVPNEEKMMIQQFGHEYQLYMRKTGRIFPSFTSGD